MRLLKKLSLRFGIARDLIDFLWQRRLWWLIPFIVVLLILGGIFILAQSSGVAPFIYSLF